MGLIPILPFLFYNMATNKTCLGKLVTNIRVNCGVPQHGIEEMLLADFGDINSIVDDSEKVNSIAFGDGTPILIETYKMSAQAVEALRALDGGAALQQTVSFTIYDKQKTGSIISRLMNKRVLIIAKYKELGLYRVFGARCGLEIASSDIDSNDAGGYAKLSFATPEGAQGESSLTIAASLYNSYKSLIPSN